MYDDCKFSSMKYQSDDICKKTYVNGIYNRALKEAYKMLSTNVQAVIENNSLGKYHLEYYFCKIMRNRLHFTVWLYSCTAQWENNGR